MIKPISRFRVSFETLGHIDVEASDEGAAVRQAEKLLRDNRSALGYLYCRSQSPELGELILEVVGLAPNAETGMLKIDPDTLKSDHCMLRRRVKEYYMKKEATSLLRIGEVTAHPPNLLVDHKDGDPQNNTPENLAYSKCGALNGARHLRRGPLGRKGKASGPSLRRAPGDPTPR